MVTMRLSENFSLEELIYSDTALRLGIVNEPGAASIANLVRLCEELLEPARALVGPLVVNSGFRCEELNAKVSGAKTSAHREGRAADVVPMKMSLKQAFDVIRYSDFLYDQVILEPSWIHLGIASIAKPARRQALLARRTDAGMVYEVAP